MCFLVKYDDTLIEAIKNIVRIVYRRLRNFLPLIHFCQSHQFDSDLYANIVHECKSYDQPAKVDQTCHHMFIYAVAVSLIDVLQTYLQLYLRQSAHDEAHPTITVE